MNVKELTNISPDKLFELLEMSSFDIEKDINKVPNYIKEWLINLAVLFLKSPSKSYLLLRLNK